MRNNTFISSIIFTLIIGSLNAAATTMNGFDLDGALVPTTEILSGGPPKDGILAIDKPVFIKASAAKNTHNDERVLAICAQWHQQVLPCPHHELA